VSVLEVGVTVGMRQGLGQRQRCPGYETPEYEKVRVQNV